MAPGRWRPQPATAIALLALVVSLGGTAYAGGLIQTGDIASGAVTSGKIRDRSIAAVDIRAGAIAAGQIANGAVSGVAVADGSLRAADLASGEVVTGHGVVIANVADLADGATNTVITTLSGFGQVLGDCSGGRLTTKIRSQAGPSMAVSELLIADATPAKVRRGSLATGRTWVQSDPPATGSTAQAQTWQLALPGTRSRIASLWLTSSGTPTGRCSIAFHGMLS